MTNLPDYDYEPYPGEPVPATQAPQKPGPRMGQLITVVILAAILIAILIPILVNMVSTNASVPAYHPNTAPTASTVPSTPQMFALQAPTATVGVAYSYKVSGPSGSYTVTGGMPTGLTISPTRVISGIPTVPGTYGIGVMIATPEALLPPQYIQLIVVD